MNIFAWLADQQIEEAIARGEFDNLPGQGQPLNLEEDENIPPEWRLAHRIMKNAGVAPPEVSLRKELDKLKTELANARTDAEREKITQEIRLMCLRINLLMKK